MVRVVVPGPDVAADPGLAAHRGGESTLICAPTGSGKTLTAFLASIDRLVTTPRPDARTHRTRVLYISPLRALAFDIEKNLRAPLIGIGLAAERLGVPFTAPEVAMRTGDTPSNDRQKLIRRPPDLLITTPESLYLMLTSSAQETLQGVETVIIDEIHAMATTKRGAHLALSLERLEQITPTFQRIGLSATQRPLSETADSSAGGRSGQPLPRTGPDRRQRRAQAARGLRRRAGRRHVAARLDRRPDGAWPVGHGRFEHLAERLPRVLEQILAHRTTIIFCNARRAAERLAAKLNELAESQGVGCRSRDRPDARRTGPAHHGSLAREQRVVIEDQLKRGELRAIVATSSLELGIDMGAVDLVIQVESPGAVSRGMQRIGRAGHQVGEPSKGTIYPKHRGDLIEAAVVTRRMIDGEIEHSNYLRNPLDVLAQQIVAHVAGAGETSVAELVALIRRCANFHDITDDIVGNVLDLLAGRYPSEEFSELRPRIVWDRVNDTIRARDGSKRLAVTSGGTIPDRGLFGVFLPDGTRVGELDEEMVYESRPGETFLLGASTWRIEDITFERVTVTPAPGQPGKMPFWHGDRPGRPLELGRALGAFVREMHDLDEPRVMPDNFLRTPGATLDGSAEHYALDAFAAGNLAQYLREQAEATGVVPDDRTIVVERFRDEIGDWRVCILSPFGTPVHAPWAMAIEQRLLDRFDLPTETMWGDDGIVIRLPESADDLDRDVRSSTPTRSTRSSSATLPQTSLFSARFRECAGRALLLPRRRPDKRTPLWQQRQRAADLLAVASKYPTFPILLEASRECLQDVFDVPALREVLRQVQTRTGPFGARRHRRRVRWRRVCSSAGSRIHVRRRRTARRAACGGAGTRPGSPARSARSGGAPRAPRPRCARRRRARPPTAVRRPSGSVGRRAPRCAAKGGRPHRAEIDLRCTAILSAPRQRRAACRLARRRCGLGRRWMRQLGEKACGRDRDRRRGPLHRCRGRRQVPRRARVCDPGRLACCLHRPGPTTTGGAGRPLCAYPRSVPRPPTCRARSVRHERIAGALAALAGDDRIVLGEFRPDGSASSCDVDVLRQLRRRSLASLRREVEPVEQAALARFLPAWHEIPARASRVPRHWSSRSASSPGAPLVASTLERDVLPARIARYRAAMLDELCTAGEVVWIGAGAVGARDGRVRLCFADQFAAPAPGWEPRDRPDGPVHEAIRLHLAEQGASFWSQFRAPRPVSTTPSCSPHSGIWCGRARSRTTRSHRCARWSRGPK